MNFGRRSFLKFVGVAIAGTTVSRFDPVISQQNYFIDNRLGFGFIAPKGWEVEAFSGFESVSRKQIVDTQDRTKEELEIIEEMSSGKGLSVVVSKYPVGLSQAGEKYIFSPSVTFFMEDDAELKNFESLQELCEQSIEGFGSLLKEYQCFDAPQKTQGINFEAVRAKSKFLFECENMDPVMVDDEFMLVHYRNKIYSIHLYDSPYENDVAQYEFARFKESLHIA